MKPSARAKYFCENCGKEVAANARFCPHCGRFFSAVRCPKCDYSGAVTAFKKGCPRCHYAMTHEDIYGKAEDVPSVINKKNHFYIKHPKQRNNKPKESFSNDAPVWLYFVSIIAFFVMLGIILFRCSR